ncbi:polysaccharide deacetylase family protein [Abyssicoccus albus]|uniref:polysaccharide deacetylase family protein n=1 Tax=Abyssicoccus albus TaxID=1817405 RepID=UPI00097E3EA5|nr:polysaccharide deacetylase family protein [Abyssicoccus albus]AQL56412.1 hypothetical protein BVH56_05500 [Abyssicoccus albus]
MVEIKTVRTEHDDENLNIINWNFGTLIQYLKSIGIEVSELKGLNATHLEEARKLLEEAKATNATNEDVQRQLNNLIIESGNANAEVSQARESYDVLNTRLNALDSKISNLDEYANTPVLQTKQQMPLISFVDDDAYPQVYEMLKPIAEEFKVPIVSAVITSRVFDQENYNGISMTFEQLKECQKAGMELQSHSVNHQRTGELPFEEQEFEIAESKRWMSKYGFNTEAFIYPFGSNTPETEKLVRKYYKAGIHTSGGVGQINYQPIPKQARMYRVYYNELNPKTETEKNKVEYCKAQIDEAISNNGWVIIGSHCFYDGFDSVKYREVVEYAVNSTAKVVGLKEGLEIYGNIIDLPDFQVGANGQLSSYKLGNYSYAPKYIDANTHIDDFDKNTLLRQYNSKHAQENNMPSKNGGIFKVTKVAYDTAIQEYYDTTDNVHYRRDWLVDHWSEWTRYVYDTDSQVVTLGEMPHSTDSITVYPKDKISHRHYTDANALNNEFPENRAGYLITYRFMTDDFAYQTYKLANRTYMFMRTWLGAENKWSEWERTKQNIMSLEKTVTVGAIASKGIVTAFISTSMAQYYRNVIVQPKQKIPTGIIYSSSVQEPGRLQVDFYNGNDRSIDLGDISFNVTSIDV